MEGEVYWELFRRTGLPELWLLSRLREEPEDEMPCGQEEDGGTRT